MFAYLQSRRVNLQLLQESACRELVDLLEKIDGPKTLIIDDALLGPIGLISASSLFADRGIKLHKLSTATDALQQQRPAPSRDVKVNIIYIVRPQVRLMDAIAEQVRQSNGGSNEKKQPAPSGRLFHLYFVPRRSCVCLEQLEHKGVYGSFVQIEELAWNFYPLDADVVSMELPHAFRDFAIDGDPTALYAAAIGLVQLQRLYGRIPKIYGKGAAAARVWEHAKQLGAEERRAAAQHSSGDKGAIDQLILLDRAIDPLSALATQLTYAGLIDEFYGIRQNQLQLPADLFASSSRADETGATSTSPSAAASSSGPAHLIDGARDRSFFLNSGERLYAELRNKNFNEVGKILSRNARDISAQMNASAQDKSVQDMKRLVDKLPALLAQKQSVAVHTSIAELIRKQLDASAFTDDLAAEQEFMVCEDIDKASAYIEDLIARKCDLRNVLRLMCIQCAAASGFKEKVLNYYKRELAHVYGIEVLLEISNLEKAHLLHTQSESRAYAVLRKTLNLTVDDVIEVNPKDISYVHSFYAPLTARIIEQTLKPLGWQSLKSQINNLPGPTFEDFQAQLIGIGGRHHHHHTTSSTPSENSSLNIPRVVLVFFVGGCTFAEIAALRFLSQQEDNNVEFVVATTKIINKNSFLDSVMSTTPLTKSNLLKKSYE